MKANKLIIILFLAYTVTCCTFHADIRRTKLLPLYKVENKNEVKLDRQKTLAIVKYYSSKGIYDKNESVAEVKRETTTNNDAYTLALEYVGRYGSCSSIAKQFITDYLGDDYSLDYYEEVSIFDAQPGDIIYYANGGLGCQHYAIYLGGNLALQGNWLGSTVIGNIYINNASEPQFRRLIKVGE